MIVGQRLGLPFSRAEKVMGILRDLDVPLVRVVSAEPLRGSWWRAGGASDSVCLGFDCSARGGRAGGVN